MPDENVNPVTTSDQDAAAALAKEQQDVAQAHIQKIAVLAEKVVDLMVEAGCTMMDVTLLNNALTSRFNPVFFNTTVKDLLAKEAELQAPVAPAPSTEDVQSPAPISDPVTPSV